MAWTTKPDCLLAVLGLALWAPTVAWEAFVGLRLWRWFAVPLGAPNVSWAGMAGLMLLVTVLTLRVPQRPDNDDDYTHLTRVLLSAVAHLMALGMGWVIHAIAGGA